MCLKSRKEIKKCRQNKFWKDLCESTEILFFRMCYLYLKDYYLAEDATQETFIKAMKSYDSFLHNSNEKTWLIRIAINSCKKYYENKMVPFSN